VLLAILVNSGCGGSDPSTNSDSQPPTRWTNSLGMVLVPVPGTKVRFCIWETRVQDFTAFVDDTHYDATQAVYSPSPLGWVRDGHTWKNPAFEQGPTHPVTAVSWEDAKAFCAWLTEREREVGMIRTNQTYRLPTDAEWSIAIGISKEDGTTPADKASRAATAAWIRARAAGAGPRWAEVYAKAAYPWGPKWPPPKDFGNYPQDLGVDPYTFTAPVGSFAANRLGLFDLSGNVWEWCEDPFYGSGSMRVYRGGSFTRGEEEAFVSWGRGFGEQTERYVNRGFRVVLLSAR
jgi:formylglycine-generating enzyme required for sulfatase activity